MFDKRVIEKRGLVNGGRGFEVKSDFKEKEGLNL